MSGIFQQALARIEDFESEYIREALARILIETENFKSHHEPVFHRIALFDSTTHSRLHRSCIILRNSLRSSPSCMYAARPTGKYDVFFRV